MHRPTDHLSKIVTEEEKAILKERLVGENKRNLLYLGSGRAIRKGYQELPFGNVVLVDPCFGDKVRIEGKVVCVGLWSTFAVALFKELGVKYDAYITGNDGLSEGGGKFPLNGNFCLGNVLPVLKEGYLHVAFPSQYRRKWKKMFHDLPLTSTLLTLNDGDYLDPGIFSSMGNGRVWRVTKENQAPASFKLGRRNVTVQHRSIWEEEGATVTDMGTEALFVRVPPVEASNLKSVYPNVECVKDFTFAQILKYCNDNKITRLKLCPWLRGEYDSLLAFFQANEEKDQCPLELKFYHMQRQDFKQLYLRAQQSAA